MSSEGDCPHEIYPHELEFDLKIRSIIDPLKFNGPQPILTVSSPQRHAGPVRELVAIHCWEGR